MATYGFPRDCDIGFQMIIAVGQHYGRIERYS